MKTLARAFALTLMLTPRVTGDQDIDITNLERTPTHSLHRVRVRTREVLHYHASHDSSVLLEKGGGILYLNGEAHPLAPGSRIDIPRNVAHYFVHTATTPYSEALVVFTPPFDGIDRIPLSAGQKPPIPTGWRTRAARILERIFQVLTLSFSVKA